MRTNLFSGTALVLMLWILATPSASQTNQTSTYKKSYWATNYLAEVLKDTIPRAFSYKNLFVLGSQQLVAGEITEARASTNRAFFPNGLIQLSSPYVPVFAIRKGNLSYYLNSNSSSANALAEDRIHRTLVNSDVSLWNIPFSFSYNSATGMPNNNERFSMITAKLNRDRFLQLLKDKTKNMVNPEQIFASALNQLYAKRDHAFSVLRQDLAQLLKSENPELLNQLQTKINIENLSFLGIDQFLNKIISEGEQQIKIKQNLVAEMQNRQEPTTSIDALSEEIAKLQRSNAKIEKQIQLLKAKWLSEGILESIQGFEKEKQSAINKLMNDPSELVRIAESKLKPQGIQRLFLFAKTFNVGSSGIDESGLALKNILVNGLNTEFLKGNRFVAPVIGTQPGIRTIADYSYTNIYELPNIVTTAIRLGKGDLQKDFSHISFALFQQSNSSDFFPTAFNTTLPKNFVTTFSKRINLSQFHSIQTEISKSTMLNNSSRPGDGLNKLLNSDNIFDNIGISIGYNGTIERAALDQKITFRYTGQGYNNLGNAFLVGGTKELSNDLRKYFLKRKLIITTKVNFREYDFSIDERKWRSLSYVADIKWKFRKGEFIELRYQPYFNNRISKGESYLSSKSHRIAVRGNISRKVGRGFTYRNFMEAASSKDNFYDPHTDQFYSNSFVSVTTLQTLALKNQTLFFNLTGNYAKQNSGHLFGNSSLSIDAGMSFNVAKNISLSSSLVFNTIDEMYRQLAIRQAVSTVVGKKISLEGFVHAGKNFYAQEYLNIPAISGNLSICYNFK